jgi:phenylacetate-CoA ligase
MNLQIARRHCRICRNQWTRADSRQRPGLGISTPRHGEFTTEGLRKLITRCAYTIPTRGGPWSALRALESTQWLPAERLRDIQLRRLKALLNHARRTVPYYKSLDSEIFRINSLEDLAKLPVLSRQQVRMQFDQLQSSDAPRGQIVRSSGSTGVPVSVRKSPSAAQMESAARYRAYRWLGFDFGERLGHISVGISKKAWVRLQTWLANALLNRFAMDSYNIDSQGLARFARELEFKPTVLMGNPSALLLLAKFVREAKSRPKVRFIISTSDQLLAEERKKLASVFDANVYDLYASYEVGTIASECSELVGHHISSENLIVEVVGRDGAEVSPGQIGSVLVTDLNNYSMPLIRYEIGDLSSLLDDECPCGRSLPLLGRIEGRITDAIIISNERFRCLSTFESVVLYKTHVEQFQVHQSSRYELTVRAVLQPKWRRLEGEFIQRGVQSIVGEDMKVTVEFPEVIEARPSGKRHLVKSSVMPRIWEPRNAPE